SSQPAARSVQCFTMAARSRTSSALCSSMALTGATVLPATVVALPCITAGHLALHQSTITRVDYPGPSRYLRVRDGPRSVCATVSDHGPALDLLLSHLDEDIRSVVELLGDPPDLVNLPL